MPLYPRNVASQGVRPTPSPSIVFTFGFIVETIKEFGVRHIITVSLNVQILKTKIKM